MKKVIWFGVLGTLAVSMLMLGYWWDQPKFHAIYQEIGVVTRDYPARLLIAPKALGMRSFYTEVSERSKFENDQYEVIEFTEQKKVMSHMVGYFWGWKDISGSKDKLMAVKDRIFGKTYWFRVAMEKTDEWGANVTYTAVMKEDGTLDNVELLANMPKDKIKGLAKFGKKVVVKPGYFSPDVIKKDADGAIWALAIITGR